MSKWPFRVTPQLVDVVEALTNADEKLHGWALADATGQEPPTVYRSLERLRSAGWVDCAWEDINPEPGRPRRRLYWLTVDGVDSARDLVAERRPQGVVDHDGKLTKG